MMWLIGNAFDTAWHFIWGWGGITAVVGIIATTVAILEPKQLDTITDLRKWCIVVAVCAFVSTGLLAHGYSNGLAVKQSQTDASVAREAVDGEKARDDADRTVGPVPTSRELLRSDPFNRNLGELPRSK